MKKWQQLGIVLFSLTLGFSSTSMITKASSWHKGTPSLIRGTWSYNPKGQVWGQYRIKKASYYSGQMGMPEVKVTGVKYRALGHYKYELTGNGHKNGMYKGGKDTIVVKRQTHYLYVKLPGQTATKYYHGGL
ncbi:hypothetical protein [Secundilactobacillus paracollinoides]|uniref:hypothetical protein n=1 Tax=Secundilactobacillus paracollinoides TaxID=240427 RepID=UPI0006D240FC|nr:hypothetical protein [Secundilactobacillus paracollinoides]